MDQKLAELSLDVYTTHVMGEVVVEAKAKGHENAIAVLSEIHKRMIADVGQSIDRVSISVLRKLEKEEAK